VTGRAGRRGFTLVELMVAVFILGLMLAFVYETLMNALRIRDKVVSDLESPKTENAILDTISRDLRFVWYQSGVLPGNSGFWGRNKQVNGREADRLDFLTSRSSRIAELEDAQTQPGDSPLTEVGYACRPNDQNSRWVELWRREDYFVDDDPTEGGKYSLVYDKIRKFNLRYFPLPDDPTFPEDSKGLDEWDSKTTTKIAYAIILDLEYDLREPGPNDTEPDGKVTKIFILKPARSVSTEAAMDAGMGAMR
jgi:general secretion pathway protein J